MTSQELKINFKSLKILHAALILGALSTLTIFLFLLEPSSNQENRILLIVPPVILIFGLMASQFMFKKTLSALKREDDLMTKFTTFRSASVLRFALVEGPTLINVVFTFLTGNRYLAIGALVGVGYLILIRPTKQQLMDELKATSDQLSIIEQS